MGHERQAVVVGSGPNGLAAAIRLAQAGAAVSVIEAEETIGGGLRSLPLTLPGFVHDLCAAVLPLALASPFLTALPLAERGLRWVQPPLPLAHPFDDGTAVVLDRSVEATAAGLAADGPAWRAVFAPLAADADRLLPPLLGPLRPAAPLRLLARFAVLAALPASALARARFRGEPARALFAGLAAHSFLRLEDPASAGFGLLLGLLGQTVGWPFVAGGSQRLADALVAHLLSLGGAIVTGSRITRWDDLPPAAAYLFDTDPRQVAAVASDRLPVRHRRRLLRHAPGPGAFKLDFALDGPVPWAAAACRQAGTVHLGGTLEEIGRGERAVLAGRCPGRPFVLLVQPSLFDPSRAPAGRQTVWAYCHVPNGSAEDMTDRIEAQIERFAPGFRDRVVARAVSPPARLEALNANEVGGAINGGVQGLAAILRQAATLPSPYATGNPRVWLCSASTPPGGGVHGMSGFHAANAALRSSPLRL